MLNFTSKDAEASFKRQVPLTVGDSFLVPFILECVIWIKLCVSWNIQIRVSTFKKFRVYWPEETTDYYNIAICIINQSVNKFTVFVVILHDISNRKCVETGFVIQVTKSHPKLDVGRHSNLIFASQANLHQPEKVLVKMERWCFPSYSF